MPIDFEIPADAKAIREKVRKWVQDECIPAEKELDSRPFDEVLGKLRTKARAKGLWCPFVPKEYGGMGLGPLANALVQMELGESMLGALSMNTQGPDDASMLTILEHGTPQQKERFLKSRLTLVDGRQGNSSYRDTARTPLEASSPAGSVSPPNDLAVSVRQPLGGETRP